MEFFKRSLFFIIVAIVAALGFVLGALFVVSTVPVYNDTEPVNKVIITDESSNMDRIPPVLFEDGPYQVADMVEGAQPAVVFITAEYKVRQNVSTNPFFNDPFFRRFFGDFIFPETTPQVSYGTGFIISEDGYILTNQHVIDNPENINSIKVTVLDHEEPFEAKLIGYDYILDLAVLKITGNEHFRALPLGDSEKARIGEWVVAIGNPFGYEHTVTVGTLSAQGRQIEIPDRSGRGGRVYENLMQTDAAINPGNSGGPLLNIKGQVIGVNTAVDAQGQGIGFAIPINVAKGVINDLITHGKISRPWLGIWYWNITDQVAASLKLDRKDGVFINEIMVDSPAHKYGLKVADVIIKVKGTPITNVDDMKTVVESLKIGEKVPFVVIREGQERTINVTIGERPQGM